MTGMIKNKGYYPKAVIMNIIGTEVFPRRLCYSPDTISNTEIRGTLSPKAA
jgi:hypothetical protein